VVFNDRAGAVDALDRMVQEGYTRIAHFGGYSSTSVGKSRMDGYLEALRKNGIQVKKEWIFEGGFEWKDGYESFLRLCDSGDLPEVIFTVNDRVALGAYRAARESGLRIPEDIGIYGFGFHEITDFLDPKLTVIDQDPRKMGRVAMKQLLDEIEEKSHRGVELYLDEEFLWRNSVKKKEG